ncbi:MAG: hypothetical protein HOK71_14470 [Planctomycetaceae bacterium]|nr:hypothetical protein [Planctomycetaceae bacterium]
MRCGKHWRHASGTRQQRIATKLSSLTNSLTAVILLVALAFSSPALAQSNPTLSSVFPPGGRAGTSVEVTLAGSGLGKLTTLHCGNAELTFEKTGPNRVRINIPPQTPPGFYDLRAVCVDGLSSPRAFIIGTREERLEVEPNESAETATTASLNSVVNGRIEKKGDIDQLRFLAKQGQHIVVECQAERIDSQLRAVLEVYDSSGRRLAANRGYFGIDPLIHFRVPADGSYIVKVFDLIYGGGADYSYRLSIGNTPRVVFSHPAVIQAGKTTRVTLLGWNLKTKLSPAQATVAGVEETESQNPIASTDSTETNFDTFDRVEVDVTPPADGGPQLVRLQSNQVSVDGFAYHFPGSDEPIQIGVTDVPVVRDQASNNAPGTAQSVSVPCEVSGQLIDGDERDWYAFEARRGEVLWLEGFAARIGASVDLDISVLDASGKRELARFSDEVKNIGGNRFSTSHLDPVGRWVVPADGRYLILVRNLIGDLSRNPERVYRLSVRREESDFHLAIVGRQGSPAALNLQRGGRTIVDVLAFRSRGMTGTIRVSARNLPPGIECPDVYLGPGINRAPLTLSATDSAESIIHNLQLVGHAEPVGGWDLETRVEAQESHGRSVRGGTVIRTGEPNGLARLTSEIPFAVTGEAPLQIIADGNETRKHDLYGVMKVRHSPGGILDVAVQIDRRDVSFQAPVQLVGVGLPALIRHQSATIPAGQSKGYVSFYLPPTLPVGRYTIAVKAVTTVPAGNAKGKPQSVTVFSNPVTFDVKPAAFVVEIDDDAPTQIGRGEVLQVKFSARRINGFIGKMHTELTAPEKVIGLRGRGTSFVGQTDSGNIQIIANDDAPLGQQPFVRFYAVGVVEDQPVFHGSCFLNLEIIE